MPELPPTSATGHAPDLLVVAHGTRSSVGTATTERLVSAVATQRPWVRVAVCYLDVRQPSLPSALTGTDQAARPTVVLPLFLSTGQHVQVDIPDAVAGRRQVRVARHLGPDPKLTEVLVDRLAPLGDAAATVLVGAGSTRPEAGVELRTAGDLLAARLGCPVHVLTMADDIPGALRTLRAPVRVAPYLLTEGQFVDQLTAAATGLAAVGEPLGLHPALVSLVWSRFDAVAAVNP